MAAETVDTRVVEAKFDSKQFEQGVDKTVKKLDELKKSLNLKDSEKSIADIGNKISETSEKASNSLEQLEKRFTSFFGMLKQKLISGIADEIVGSLFKMKNAVLGFVQTLSTGQIGYGMRRYTDILTSVRTLTAAGVNENSAYTTIERLGQYADQTSYSLDQLVDTMSKFKTAGADITTAQRMVEGLSNAAASMGVNAQDATRAYLNMQQAYSKGRMTQADWISFESLPMVGEKFNQAIIDAAVKVGTLKETKPGSGTYQIDTKGIKAGGNVSGVRMSGAATKGITAQNMGTKLASGWFDKRVMEEVFGSTYYFAEVGIDEVNDIKKKEREIRADLRKQGVNEAELDAKTTDELQKYFDEVSKEKIDTKKKEIEERKLTAKAELDAKKGTKEEIKKAKEDYDKLIKDLDKEMKDFEANNHLSAFAYQAFAAGQEARSFNDVMNTLKDTISRGWATSFELIFGKLDEAKDFFTSLTESQFAEGIYRIGEFRNLVLENWRNYGGRDSMLDFLQSIDDIFGSIYKKIGLIEDEEKQGIFDQAEYDRLMEQDPTGFAATQYKNWAEATDPFKKMAQELGLRLTIMTRNIKLFIEDVKHWLTDIDSYGSSRLQRISNILEGFGKVGSGALKAVGMGFEFLGKLYTQFKPAFDALWKVLDEVSAKYFDVFDQNRAKEDINIFQVLADTFVNILNATQPLVKPLTRIIEILGDVASFISDMAISTALGNITFFTDAFALLLEILGIGSAQQKRGAGILDGIVAGIRELGETCKEAFSAVSEFVNSAFADLKKALGLDGSTSGQDQNVFQNIQNWFDTNEFVQNVKTKVNKALIDIGDFVKDLPNRIVDLGVNIGDAFKGLFFDKKLSEIRYEGNRRVEIYAWVKKPLTQWITNAADAVWNFVTVEIPKFVKNIPNIVSEFLNGLFYTKNIAQISYANGKRTVTYVRTPLKKWIDNAIVEVKKFIKDIPNQLKKIPSLIEEFFKSMFYYKTSVANGGVTWVKKPFTQWVDENIVKNLKTFITELPTYIGQAIGTVSNFAGQVVSAIFGKEDGSPVTADDVTEGLRKPFLGVNVTGIINSIKGVAKRILNGVASAFTGETDWESNKNWLAEGAAKLLDNIKTKASEAWDGVSGFFEDLPNKIRNFFAGPEANAANEPNGTIGSAVISFANKVGEWISKIPNILLNAWKSAEALSTGLWDLIIKWIAGGSKSGNVLNVFNQNIYDQMRASGSFDTAEMFKESALKQQWREDNPVAANIEDFIKNLVQYLGDKITHIPEDIVALWGNACTIVKAVSDVLTDNVDGTLQDEDPVYSIATNVFTSIRNWFVDNKDKLVGIIKSGWDKAVTIGSIIGEVLFGDEKPVFDPKRYDELLGPKGLGRAAAEAYKQGTKDYGVYNGIANFFDNIKDWVLKQARDLPKNIAKAWDGIVNFAGEVGPKILEGLNSALNFVKTGFEKVTSWISNPDNTSKDGKKLSVKEMIDNYVDSPEGSNLKPLWDGIKKVGSTLKTIILETIPGFISEAIEEIKNRFPDMISGIFNFFGSENKDNKTKKELSENVAESMKEIVDLDTIFNKDQLPFKKVMPRIKKTVKEADGAKEGLSDLKDNLAEMDGEWKTVMAGFSGFGGLSYSYSMDGDQEKKADGALEGIGAFADKLFSTFGRVADVFQDKGGQILLAMIGIVLILHQLNDMISIRDTFGEIGYAAKWQAIEIAIAGIVGILGYLTYLASTDDGSPDGKFAKVKIIFEELKTFIKELGELIKAITIVSAIKEGAETIGDLFGKSEKTGLVGGILQSLANLGVFAIGSNVVTNGIETLFDGLADTFSTMAVGIDNFIAQLEPAIKKMSKLYDESKKAIETIGNIDSIVILLYNLVGDTQMAAYAGTDLPERQIGDKDYTIWRTAVNSIQQSSDLILVIASFINRLADGLKAFHDIEDPSKELDRVNKLLGDGSFLSDGFTRFLNNIVEAVYAIWDNGLKQFNGDQSSFEGIITLIGSTLDFLASSIKNFDMESVTAISKMFELLEALISADTDGSFKLENLIKKHNDLGSFGLDLQKFGRNIEKFFENANKIKDILVGEDKIMDETEESTYEKTFDWIAKVSGKMIEVANSVTSDPNVDKMEYIGRALPEFGLHVMEFLNTINGYTFDKELNYDFVDSIVDLMNKIKDLTGVASPYFNFENVPKNFEYIAEALVGSYHDIEDTNGELNKSFGREGGLFEVISNEFNSERFDFNGIERIVEILYKLSNALETFYETDQFGDFKYQSALENLRDIEWDTVLPEFTKPTITPVLELTEFRKSAEEMYKLLGIKPLEDGTWISPDYSVTISGIDLPQLSEINNQLKVLDTINTAVDQIRSNTDGFSSDLRNLQFNIDGTRLVGKIGPVMDRWLGQEGVFIVRANFNNGSGE